MFSALLLLQGSLLLSPLQISDQIPDSRALRGILIVHKEVRGVSAAETRTREEARAQARELQQQLVAGADFEALARSYSSDRSAGVGGVLGTFFPGFLSPEVDAYLFQAQVGEVSPVFESGRGFQIVQRIERDAGCLQIQLEGLDAFQQAQDLLARLQAGADFSELARQHSTEKSSAARGGQWGIFQRSSKDAVLRAACFRLQLGEIAGPIESPLGWHLIKRVPVEQIDPALADDVAARVRCILISFQGAARTSYVVSRTHSEAERLAKDLAERIKKGEDMAQLAREFDDDRGGRDRAGDLGWIRRHTESLPAFLGRVFVEPKGSLIGPIPTEVGWVLLRREQ